MKLRRVFLHPKMTFLSLALMCIGAGLFTRRSDADARPGRYVLKAGRVMDTKTKLVWQQEVAPSPLTFSEATAYCKALTLSDLAWRLPSVKELETIVDESRIAPAIDQTAFPATPTGFFWTASLVADFPDNAWVVDFYRGGDRFLQVDTPQLIRCVH